MTMTLWIRMANPSDLLLSHIPLRLLTGLPLLSHPRTALSSLIVHCRYLQERSV